jgi:hypothetical protein
VYYWTKIERKKEQNNSIWELFFSPNSSSGLGMINSLFICYLFFFSLFLIFFPFFSSGPLFCRDFTLSFCQSWCAEPYMPQEWHAAPLKPILGKNLQTSGVGASQNFFWLHLAPFINWIMLDHPIMLAHLLKHPFVSWGIPGDWFLTVQMSDPWWLVSWCTVGRKWKVAAYFGFQSSKPQIWNHEAWSGDS